MQRNTTLRSPIRILRGVSKHFGDRLRLLRTRAGFTPSSLAQAVDVTEGAIRQMESGQTKSASFVVGLRLARVLGVTPWFLATGEDAPSGKESRSPEPAPGVAKIEDVLLKVNALERRVRAVEVQQRAGKRRRARE